MVIEVLFTPAEYAALGQRDLNETICVVFDVLRATSTIVTALANGATEIHPVLEIADAVALRKKHRDILLAGERNGLRITAELSGGIGFEFGNSPREFTSEAVRGRKLVMTTTNGTLALVACRKTDITLAGSLLNLKATAKFIQKSAPKNLLLVCGGTGTQTALEDVLGAGALIAELSTDAQLTPLSDSARIALTVYEANQEDLVGAFSLSQNGRRLLDMPELREDVAYCAQRDVFDLVAALNKDGAVRTITK